MVIDKLILKNLLKAQTYTRKVIPFLKPEYFRDGSDRLLFQTIANFLEKYKTPPTYDALQIEVDSLDVFEEQQKALKAAIEEIKNDQTITTEAWLVDETEKFCKLQAIYNGLTQSIEIVNGKNKNFTEDAIVDIMKQALSVSFNTNVGHNFLDQWKERFDYYHRVEEKIPFDLDYFNRITEGGVSKGTLNIILAGTGVGKSLTMGHFAAAAMVQGKNVLYITLELSEKEVARRVDANLLDVKLNDLKVMPEAIYEAKSKNLKAKTTGKMIIKQYPTAAASVAHFRALLNELYLKQNFKPDIIFLDYLNLCVSSRLKRGNANSYEYVKAIAEEVRGLAVEYDVPVWSATQVTRAGFTSSDIGLEDTSESFGLPATADLMLAMISNENLEKMGRVAVKQLKNRYGDPSVNKRFIIGIERAKMRLFDVAESEQTLVDANNQQVQQPQKRQPMQTKPFATTPPKNYKGLKVA